MARSVSSAMRTAMYAQETGEAAIVLLTIDHDELDDPIRVCHNEEDITSNSIVFAACQFEVALPDEKDNQPPQSRLRIQNVDRVIVDTIRTLTSPPSITIQIVLASSPDTVEANWDGLILKDCSYDMSFIEGNLGFEDILSEPFPGHRFIPSGFPGLFG